MKTKAAKPTPAPWRWQVGDIHDHGDERSGFTILMADYGPSGGAVRHVIQYADGICEGDNDYPEAEANARLIAAAPLLLAECEAALKRCRCRGRGYDRGVPCLDCKCLRALLADVKGEPEKTT